jgi:FkbM family methyltransferase
MNPLLRLAAFAARLLPTSLKQGIYSFKPFARLLRKSLNRAAPLGMSQVQVAAGGLQGCTLVLDMQTEKDYWLGTYEPELQAAIQHWIRPGSTVYDVGANIGYVSLLLGLRTGQEGKVFAFEALPANIARLTQNFSLNPIPAHLHTVHAAIVDRSAPVRFWVHSSNAMGKAVGSAGREHPEEYVNEIEVPGLSLDEFCYGSGNPSPQVIKMDIEGGEVLAVNGMLRLLAEARPLLLVELHGHAAARAVWAALMQHNYTVHRMQPAYLRVETVDQLDWKAYIVAQPS